MTNKYGVSSNFLLPRTRIASKESLVLNHKATSSGEKEVFSYIESLGFRPKHLLNAFETNLDIDIYIPERNIGIEYDGIVWHSTKFHNDKYNISHKNKILNIPMIHIYSDEWEGKQEVCKDLIRLRLGVPPEKIYYARKCRVKQIKGVEAFAFCEQNHIQGGVKSSKAFGLFHDDELLMVMTFIFDKKRNSWNNSRTSVRLNTGIVGGFDKLLKDSGMSSLPIHTWIDKRWFNAEGHNKHGFKQDKSEPPTFDYVDKNGRRLTRMNLNKELRITKNKGEQTRKDFAQSKGFYRIYNAGRYLVKRKSDNN
jgi:hypothetical protein